MRFLGPDLPMRAIHVWQPVPKSRTGFWQAIRKSPRSWDVGTNLPFVRMYFSGDFEAGEQI